MQYALHSVESACRSARATLDLTFTGTGALPDSTRFCGVNEFFPFRFLRADITAPGCYPLLREWGRNPIVQGPRERQWQTALRKLSPKPAQKIRYVRPTVTPLGLVTPLGMPG